MTRFLSIISGSHRVGKTTLAINLAVILKKNGKRPLLVTEDTSWLPFHEESNSDGILDLQRIIADQENMAASIITGPSQIELINLRLVRDPGKNLTPGLVESFCRNLAELDGYDFLILDIAGGLTQTSLSCCLSPCDCILVATPEARVLNQTLRLLKLLSANGFHDPLRLIINQADSVEAAGETYNLLRDMTANSLHIPLEYMGHIRRMALHDSDRSSIPMLMNEDANHQKDFENIATFFEGNRENFHGEMNSETFWAQMIELLSYPFQMPVAGTAPREGNLPGKVEFTFSNGQDIVPLLKSISEHLGTISQELVSIRSMFETEVGSLGEKKSGFDENGDCPGIISLDLEGFAAQSTPRKSEK